MTIRPFVAPNDLDTMNALIMEGFEYPDNPEWSVQADDKENLMDRVRGAKRMWPIMRILQIFSPLLRDIMRGFIAEQNGQPAGLINFMRQRDEPEWTIANVTVLPAHRRKGLARQLVEATLAELRKRRAKIALLGVVDGNLPAVKLYQALGFETYSGSLEMDLEAGAAVSVPDLPPGWTFAPVSRFDWRARYELAKRITPETVARYEPPLESRFRVPISRPIFGTMFNRFGGSDFKRMALRAPGGEITGFAWYGYRLRPGGVNSAEIDLDPAHPEQAAFMVAHAIAAIQSLSPGRRVVFEFANWQPALSQAAQALGARKLFAAHHMGLKFK